MKVKDVVRAAAETLRLTDAVNFCDGKNESDAEKAAAGEAEAKKLLEFFNDTETELAVLAVPLIKDEKVTAVNGEIALSALSENFVRALRLTDNNGRRAALATGAGALKTDADEGILRYAYLPAKKTLDGESDFRCGVVLLGYHQLHVASLLVFRAVPATSLTRLPHSFIYVCGDFRALLHHA